MDMESLESWVDTPSIHSGLSGMILVGLAFWSAYMLTRLWQRSLAEDALGAIQYSESQGLKMRPAGLSPRVSMCGDIDGFRVEVIWCGGVLGHRMSVEVDGRIYRAPFMSSASELEACLADTLGQHRARTQA